MVDKCSPDAQPAYPVRAGIIAIASSQQGIALLADVLYVVAALMYVVLILTLLTRVLRYRAPVGYSPAYWALVFPIGMYGAATFRMRDAIHLRGLTLLPQVTLLTALRGS
jgi:tellurite resistance protein TehA-like permease